MVKRLTVLLFVLSLLSLSVFADSYTAYRGSFSSSFLSVFRDVAEGLTCDSYVAWRNDDNDYAMYIGDDLTETNGVFIGGAGRIVSLSTVRWTDSSGSSYRSYTDYYIRDVDEFKLITNNVLVYSSLDDYPALKQGGEVYEMSLIIVVAVALLSVVFIRIFSWRRY